MRRIGTAAALVVSVIVVTAAPAAADPGDLDPNFGGTGHVSFPHAGNQDAVDVVVRPSGRVAVVSVSGTVVQFLPNGDPDPDFGIGGLVEGTPGVDIRAAALDSQGKLILAGSEGDQVYVARLLPGGDPDTSFSGGSATTSFPHEAYAEDVAVDANDRLVVAGETGVSKYRFALVRYRKNGDLDPTFSDDGKATTQLMGSDYASAVAIGSDGSIVAAGSAALTHDDPRSFGVVRYHPNGHLDRTFSGDGKATVRIGPTSDGQSVLIQPDGKVVVGGVFFHPVIDWAIARFTAGGKLDHSFSGDGKLTRVFGGGPNFLEGIVRQQDGDLVAGGSSGDSLTHAYTLVRYHENGTLDAGFGDAGTAIENTGDDPFPRAIAKAPHSKIVIGATTGVGSTDGDLGAARFLAGE